MGWKKFFRRFYLIWAPENTFSLWRSLSTSTDCLEGLWNISPWRYWKLVQTWSWGTGSGCLYMSVGWTRWFLSELLSNLNHETLWLGRLSSCNNRPVFPWKYACWPGQLSCFPNTSNSFYVIQADTYLLEIHKNLIFYWLLQKIHAFARSFIGTYYKT